jgi:hypothetical protein
MKQRGPDIEKLGEPGVEADVVGAEVAQRWNATPVDAKYDETVKVAPPRELVARLEPSTAGRLRRANAYERGVDLDVHGSSRLHLRYVGV